MLPRSGVLLTHKEEGPWQNADEPQTRDTQWEKQTQKATGGMILFMGNIQDG